MQAPTSIIIADATYLVRFGLSQLLSNTEQFNILAEVATEQALFKQLEAQHPQVIILDFDQEEKFSISTLQKLKVQSPDSNIMVISGNSNQHKIDQVLALGVKCYLTKSCGAEEIFDGIKAVAKGEKFFCNKILDHLLERSYAIEKKVVPQTPLTPREIEIVRLVAKGMIAKEIGKTLHLSTHTVYTHRKNIMKKLGINTSSELVLYAINSGILPQEVN